MTDENQTPATETSVAETDIMAQIVAIDMQEVMARIAVDQQRRDDCNAKDRVALHVYLVEQGVTRVDARYDGYCDSGNVDTITLTPDTATIEEAKERALGDFIWSMAYALHPGFENNEGAEGEFEWDVTEDKINIEHREFYTECNDYSHEGL